MPVLVYFYCASISGIKNKCQSLFSWSLTEQQNYSVNCGPASYSIIVSSNQTRFLIMIAPAYATAHMSQILICWTRRENAASLNRSSKHFRCVPLWFSISILWEFNLIPTDISPGTVFFRKKGNKKIRTDWRFFSHSGAPGYLGICLCLTVWQSLSLSLRPLLQRLFYLICGGCGHADHKAEGAFME